MRVRARSFRSPGRLVPPSARGLRAGAVRLAAGQIIDWHSTQAREELIVVLAGRVEVQVQRTQHQLRRYQVAAGSCVWLAQQTLHRVVNASRTATRYLYVTAAVIPRSFSERIRR